MSRSGRSAAAILILFFVVYIATAGSMPLSSPDETRYAEIPREMIESGDWVVPRLAGVQYFEKPPLGYWLTAVSILAFGENSFAVRFPSACAVGLTAAILFFLVRRWLGPPKNGQPDRALLAAAIYLTFPIVYTIGSLSVLDNLLTLFLTGTLAAFYVAFQEERARPRLRWLVAAGICCGLAFLVKGFLALAVPGLVLGAWALLERRWRQAFVYPWLPLLVAALVVLPWGVLVHLRAPDFWRYFFWVEHVNRFLEPVGRSQHPEPAWFFLPFLVAGILPWLPMLPAAVAGFSRDQLRVSWVRFCLAWVVLPFLFFSASSGKLPTYILPCFPPLAALIAVGVSSYLAQRGATRLFRGGAVVSGLAAVAGIIGLLGPGRAHYGDAESWKWILFVCGLLAWCGAAWMAARPDSVQRRIWTYAAAPLFFLAMLRIVYPYSVEDEHVYGRLLLAEVRHVAPDAVVVTDANVVHAASWFLKRDDVLILERGGELSYGLEQADQAHRRIDADAVVRMLTDEHRNRDVVLALDRDRYARSLESRLGELEQAPLRRAEENSLVFLQYAASEASHD